MSNKVTQIKIRPTLKGEPYFHRRDVIRTRGLRFASVGAKRRSPGPPAPSAPERREFCPLEVMCPIK